MGKVITSQYRIEYQDNTKTYDFYTKDHLFVKTMSWVCNGGVNRTGYGHPSPVNLKAWRDVYNASFDKDGVNYHISKSVGFIVRIHWARIVNQKTGRVVSEYIGPKFELV